MKSIIRLSGNVLIWDFSFLLCLFFHFNTFCKLLIIIIKIWQWLQKCHRTKCFHAFGQDKSDYTKHDVSTQQWSSPADSATRGGVISKLQIFKAAWAFETEVKDWSNTLLYLQNGRAILLSRKVTLLQVGNEERSWGVYHRKAIFLTRWQHIIHHLPKCNFTGVF